MGDFPQWLASFHNLVHVEASLPRPARVFNSTQKDKYDEILEIRSNHRTSDSESLKCDILTWVAEPGKAMDWSKVARHLRGLGEPYEPNGIPSGTVS